MCGTMSLRAKLPIVVNYGTLIPTTGPFLYLLARQCRINWLGVSFSTMAACVRVPNWKNNVLGVSAVIRYMCMVTSDVIVHQSNTPSKHIIIVDSTILFKGSIL